MSKPIAFNKVDIKRIKFTPLEDNKRCRSQKIGYVRYINEANVESQFKVKTPQFCSEVYGIPRENPEFYPTIAKRSFYKLGYCHERHKQQNIKYEEVEQFMNLLISIDNMCDTDAFRKTLFGDKSYNQYQYTRLVRIPDEEIDEKTGELKYRPPFSKLKLELEYCKDPDDQTNKPVFDIVELKDGARQPVVLETFDDVLRLLKFMNKLRFIISFNKIYAMNTKSGSDKKKYGITMKATTIEVEQSVNNISTSTGADDFDSGSDSDSETKKVTKVVAISRNNLDPEVGDEYEDELEADVSDEVDETSEENLKRQAKLKQVSKSKSSI
jgi:hypothetical protein